MVRSRFVKKTGFTGRSRTPFRGGARTGRFRRAYTGRKNFGPQFKRRSMRGVRRYNKFRKGGNSKIVTVRYFRSIVMPSEVPANADHPIAIHEDFIAQTIGLNVGYGGNAPGVGNNVIFQHVFDPTLMIQQVLDGTNANFAGERERQIENVKIAGIKFSAKSIGLVKRPMYLGWKNINEEIKYRFGKAVGLYYKIQQKKVPTVIEGAEIKFETKDVIPFKDLLVVSDEGYEVVIKVFMKPKIRKIIPALGNNRRHTTLQYQNFSDRIWQPSGLSYGDIPLQGGGINRDNYDDGANLPRERY